jgi:glycosyltransferase involved in cell wall biosynthesis
MTIVQITPGAGPMYCGNCFRDNALVAALRRAGHDVTMIPLYLPLTLDEDDQSANTPIFYGGISVFLAQKSGLARKAPRWMHRMLASRKMLGWAAGRAAKTRPDSVGNLMLSMLRGEEGRQAAELDELVNWLKHHAHADVISLSNALLVGMVRRLKAELQTPVVCHLQGEDYFLDSLPDNFRAAAWNLLRERAKDVDLFVAPSRYFGELMTRRLNLPADKVRVILNGIELDGYPQPSAAGVHAKRYTQNAAPVLGFFARMCKEKGLDTLVEAYIHIKHRENIPRLKLHIGGSCGPGDEAFVKGLRKRLAESGYIGEVSFSPNLSRGEKIDFLSALSVFSVPASYGEAFGLYILEAMAAGVPVVQPRTASYPELIEATGGGVLCEPINPKALGEAIEKLILDSNKLQTLGADGQRAVFERFNADVMAEETAKSFAMLAAQKLATAN